MQVLIVHSHVEPKSFNGALTRSAVAALQEAGHIVVVSDLHAMNFNPLSDRSSFTTVKDPDYFKQQAEEMYATEHAGFAADLEAEIRKLEVCDLLIFQFPLSWFGLPAMLKGWVDRVLAMGRTYGGGRVYETGVFRGKRAMMSVTTGGSEAQYTAGGRHGDVNGVLRPIHRGIFQFIGCEVLRPQISWGPARATDVERAAMLAAWRTRVVGLLEEAPMDVGAY